MIVYQDHSSEMPNRWFEPLNEKKKMSYLSSSISWMYPVINFATSSSEDSPEMERNENTQDTKHNIHSFL